MGTMREGLKVPVSLVWHKAPEMDCLAGIRFLPHAPEAQGHTVLVTVTEHSSHTCVQGPETVWYHEYLQLSNSSDPPEGLEGKEMGTGEQGWWGNA